MALSRVTTWIAGQTLTASALNAEFDNILNNAASLFSPLTATLDLDGNTLVIDSDADSTLRATADDVVALRLLGFDAFIFDGDVLSPVNGLTLASAATGSGPTITAQGSDTNIPVTVAGKGTGKVALGQATSEAVQLVASQPITDANGNELLKFTAASSAVNELTIANAATGAEPSISATGGDTDIDIKLTPKGTGAVIVTAGGVSVTGASTITSSSAGAVISAVSTEAGAGGGPDLELYRNSASPAVSDVPGRIIWYAKDESATKTVIAKYDAIIDSVTDAAMSARLFFNTVQTGTLTFRLWMGAGVCVGNPTSGDMGAGTLNVDGGIYIDGRQVVFPTSSVVQMVKTQTGAVTTGSTAIPNDDSIPQSGEGIEVMTLAITPKHASNILEIEVSVMAAHSASGQMIAALFQDSTADALAAMKGSGPGANTAHCIKFTHTMAAGTTSSTTFKVRIGNGSGATTTFNGESGARLLGGAAASSIVIKEYVAV